MIESTLNWLLSPLSGAAVHHIDDWAAWHARAMVFSWAILLPLGAIVARFYKVTLDQDWPKQLDKKTWWTVHRWMQGIAVIFLSVGLALAFDNGIGKHPRASIHTQLGWGICVVAWLQVVGGIFRGSKGGPTGLQMRGDHYDMSRWRLYFERLHKGMGWLAIVVAVPTIALGLLVADAPRWMAAVLTVWWTGLAFCIVRLQSQGRCIDTYQAIWGPSMQHPGNKRAPVGWGVRRYTAETWFSLRKKIQKH